VCAEPSRGGARCGDGGVHMGAPRKKRGLRNQVENESRDCEPEQLIAFSARAGARERRSRPAGDFRAFGRDSAHRSKAFAAAASMLSSCRRRVRGAHRLVARARGAAHASSREGFVGARADLPARQGAGAPCWRGLGGRHQNAIAAKSPRGVCCASTPPPRCSPEEVLAPRVIAAHPPNGLAGA